MCETCGFSTHTKSAMIRHNLSHTGEKPHVCDSCGSAYADKKRLRDHVISQHPNESQVYGSRTIKTYACDFCGFSSRRKDNLRAHIRRVHPELNISHNSSTDFRNSLALPPITRPLETLPRPSVNLNMVMNTFYDPPKTEETKPDIRLVSNSILTASGLVEKSLVPDHNMHTVNEKLSANQAMSTNTTKGFEDRSHIIGHINHDGSIRPVATVTPSHSSNHPDEHNSVNKDKNCLQDTSIFTQINDKITRLEKNDN